MSLSPPLALQATGLRLSYAGPAGPVRALRGVDLSIGAGESVAVIGESGCGKSTLAQALVRLVPASATFTADTFTALGPDSQPIDVMALSEKQLAQFRWSTVAYVAQAAINAFNPVMRIRSHVMETAKAHGWRDESAVRAAADAAFTQVRLDPSRVWSAYPHEMSGGMRQRTLIALALMMRPRVLILDEPTTALDVLTQRSILDVLREIRDERTTSLVFVSHDLGVANTVADRVMTMYAGRVVESGTSSTVLSSPDHPYTRGLLDAVPTLSGLPAYAIPGAPPNLVTDLPGCSFAPRCPRAQDICRTDSPPTVRTGGHLVECHFALGED
jgi:peptide/nickel transport system ATP-binding protein